MANSRVLRWLSFLLALGLVASACGGSDPVEQADEAEVADAPAAAAEPEPEPEPEPTAAPEPEPEPAEAAEPEPTAVPEPVPTPQPVIQTEVELVSYDDDFGTSIQPLIADKCASCHGEGGPGASHWQITTAQDLVDTHLLISSVVENNYMPPWPASDVSVAFKDNRDLRPDQVQAIIDWSIAGAPLDVDPETLVVPSELVEGLVDPDAVLVPNAPYAGDPQQVDDYRCMIYDPQLPDGGWITGYEFLPDQTAVVHHAIGYVIGPDRQERAAERDGEDGRPGWECFGSSGLGRDEIFLGWAPGQDATSFPEGSGLWMPPGAFLVVQIHYHYEGDAPEDLSGLALNFASDADLEAAGGALDEVTVATMIAPVEIPCAEWQEGPLCDRDVALADAIERFGEEGVRDRITRICGAEIEDFASFTDGVASSSCRLPATAIGGDGELIAVLGHMHEIGEWIRITLNPGTADEVVLLDIPNWDFDWQYNYVPVEDIEISTTDFIGLECGWDRARQRPDIEPAYILWADGTNDEMCFATLTVREG